ncbi:MAG TPA: LysE family translocator [Stellaceae bacterium]|jgi:threonine/homoserine/homoserine lactone efflux protein|nr:LysE family translocator [Stellaceae bacterium]
MSGYLAFLGISLVVIMTPGPDTALTVRNTLLGGARGGVFTAMGVAAGQVLWASAASAGVVGLLVASAPVFEALKLVGAAYLMVIGVQTLYSAFRPGSAAPSARGAARRIGPGRALRQGLVNDLANPKMAAFFASLFPQFVPEGSASFAALMMLGLVFSAMTLAWLVAYALAVAKAGDLLRRSGIRRAIEGVTGAVLIAFGLRLASEHR